MPRRERIGGGGGQNSAPRRDWITISAALATAAIGLASLLVSRDASKRASDARLETGSLTTNAHGPGCVERWEPWQSRISPSTAYVGVKRRVRFTEPFAGTPQVMSAFQL